MDWWPTLDNLRYWHWLILGAILLMVEVTVPGAFMVWFALAAFVMGLLVFVIAGMSGTLQLLLFAILSVATVFLGRKYMMRLGASSEESESVNKGAGRFVGRVVKVTTPIENGVGRVRVGDSDWRAIGPDLPLGADVEIVSAEGSTLVVRPSE